MQKKKKKKRKIIKVERRKTCEAEATVSSKDNLDDFSNQLLNVNALQRGVLNPGIQHSGDFLSY